MNKSDALVVFSGGQDSTTCLFWAKKHFRKVYALSFIYGQKHVKEVELARAIAGKAGGESLRSIWTGICSRSASTSRRIRIIRINMV